MGQTSVRSDLTGYPLRPGGLWVQELKKKSILLQKMKEYLGLMSQDSPISYFLCLNLEISEV